MKKTFCLLLAILDVALAVRLYPTLISGMPFSTDAWPLIRNTELLVQNTPVPLTSTLFDGYNNYWPGSQLFGAALSQVTGLPVSTAMALGIPIAAAFAIPLFYLLVRKITQRTEIGLIAAFLFATAFPYALFTAGVTKETFASPILILLLLLFLLKHDWKITLLFSIASVALLFSHHLTAFLAVGIVASLSVASYISKKNPAEKLNSNKSNIIFAAILSSITALYFAFYAYPALNLTLTVNDLLSVGAYQILLTSLIIYLVFIAKNFSRTRTIFNCVVGFLLIFALTLLITEIPLTPNAPVLPFSYFLYALPFIIGLPLVIFGLNELHQRPFSLQFALFWVVPIAAFACYAVFSSISGGLGFAYRSVNFLLAPFVILVAIGLFKLVGNRKPKVFRASVILVSALIFCMVSVNVYTVYATVSLEEPYLGYFWRYEPSEYHASQWITASGNNQTIAGDAKVYYLLNGYFNQNVTILDGLRYFEGSGPAPRLLYVYDEMYKNGYVFYESSPIALPQNWTDKLTGYNQIYGNSEVTIYAK